MKKTKKTTKLERIFKGMRAGKGWHGKRRAETTTTGIDGLVEVVGVIHASSRGFVNTITGKRIKPAISKRVKPKK